MTGQAARSTSDQTSADRVSTALLAWYDVHARVLPWRVSPADSRRGVWPDPYRVWLSEIMLQQTTVAAVAGYYRRFTELWPDVGALAAAPAEAVRAEWAGLGYYARARNLHACAKIVAEDHGCIFPDTEEELLKLPGIGPYTAAAVAAIAFDRPATVVDGNVERVVARLFNIEAPLPKAKAEIKVAAATLTPAERPGDFAQAMMDLGATICTPKKPACLACPLRDLCAGRQAGDPARLPRKAPKAPKPTRYGAAFVARRADGAVLLVRRPEKGLLGGMLAAPTSPWDEGAPADPLAHAPFKGKWRSAPDVVKHTFTHFHLELSVWTCAAPRSVKADGEWSDNPLGAGLPTVMRKVIKVASGA